MNHWITFLLLLGIVVGGRAQQADKRSYTTQRLASAPPQVDGRLTDSCWQEGNWFGDYTQYMPVEGGMPSLEIAPADGGRIKMPEMTTILGAAKLTGKTRNGLSVGLIESVTQKEHAELAGPESNSTAAVEPLSNYLVGRVIKEMNEGNTIAGAMFTAVSPKRCSSPPNSRLRTKRSCSISWALRYGRANRALSGLEPRPQLL